MTHIGGAKASHAKNDKSKFAKDTMRSSAVRAAAAHSTRFGNSRGNCIRVKFIKDAEKIFSRPVVQRDVSGQNDEI